MNEMMNEKIGLSRCPGKGYLVRSTTGIIFSCEKYRCIIVVGKSLL